MIKGMVPGIATVSAKYNIKLLVHLTVPNLYHVIYNMRTVR